jgi:pSer/pThr/pTyr-binding forkhead associated (FHA) protein
MTAERTPSGVQWLLRGQIEAGGSSRTNLRPLPFLIGRLPEADLRLDSDRVSQRHAEIYADGDALCVRDLGSTNGTYVNGEAVTERVLAERDILHFADQQFQLVAERSAAQGSKTMPFRVGLGPGRKKIQQVKDLVQLLEAGAVRVEFQPLVRFSDSGIVAPVVTGRTLPGRRGTRIGGRAECSLP